MSAANPGITTHRHHAMATEFEVRITGEDAAFAAQAAQSAFTLLDQLDARLNRFAPDSEISALTHLAPDESLQISEPTFACLARALDIEQETEGAFSLAATARRAGHPPGRWTLDPAGLSVHLHEGACQLDLGAIGKGFALDRTAEELREWGCDSFLLVAGGSSVLAGSPPPGASGWTARLADPGEPGIAADTLSLAYAALGASGLALQGHHVYDPRTGNAVRHRTRAWIRADSAAEADTFSTALLVLDDAGTDRLRRRRPDLRIWLTPAGAGQA